MRTGKQQYIFTWIALLSVIIAATYLLLEPSVETMNPSVKLLTSFIAWGLVVVPAVFLFLSGSEKGIAKTIHTLEDPEQPVSSPGNKPLETLEGKSLDIQAVAGKITRRIDLHQPAGTWGRQLIDMLVSELEIMSAIFYYRDHKDLFTSVSTYATPRSADPFRFNEGEGLNGQAARNGQVQVIRTIPDQYAGVFSGLGSGSPAYLALVPIVSGKHSIALLEVAGFRWADDPLEQLFHIIARDLSEKYSAIAETGMKGNKASGHR